MQHIDVDGTKVAFKEQGIGQPVVLLHSSTGSKGQWWAAFAEWTQRYRLIAPDLRGYGDTDPWVGPRALTLADEVEIVAAIIARLNRPVHLIGHSYGGSVALLAALSLGPQVASLVLIEPTPFYLLAQAPDSELHPLVDLAEITDVANEIGEAVAEGFPMAAAHRFIDYWCGDGAWHRMTSERKWRISAQMWKVHQDFQALLTESTERNRFAAIKAPTLVLSGTNSPRPTRSLSRVVAETIPGARHRTIAGAGHMLPLTHWDSASSLIVDHMARATRTSPLADPLQDCVGERPNIREFL